MSRRRPPRTEPFNPEALQRELSSNRAGTGPGNSRPRGQGAHQRNRERPAVDERPINIGLYAPAIRNASNERILAGVVSQLQEHGDFKPFDTFWATILGLSDIRRAQQLANQAGLRVARRAPKILALYQKYADNHTYRLSFGETAVLPDPTNPASSRRLLGVRLFAAEPGCKPVFLHKELTSEVLLSIAHATSTVTGRDPRNFIAEATGRPGMTSVFMPIGEIATQNTTWLQPDPALQANLSQANPITLGRVRMYQQPGEPSLG